MASTASLFDGAAKTEASEGASLPVEKAAEKGGASEGTAVTAASTSAEPAFSFSEVDPEKSFPFWHCKEQKDFWLKWGMGAETSVYVVRRRFGWVTCACGPPPPGVLVRAQRCCALHPGTR